MATEKSYRDLKAELDELLQSFEAAEHDDVDEMLKDYDVALKLIAQLEKKLEAAAKKLKG